jgi:hypothetical protein
MRKLINLTFISTVLLLAGCSDATRTVPVLVVDERTISGDRPALTIPPDYRNPTLPQPKEDTVLRDYQKNNFIGPMPQIKTTPLPPRRPCSISNVPGCVK